MLNPVAGFISICVTYFQGHHWMMGTWSWYCFSLFLLQFYLFVFLLFLYTTNIFFACLLTELCASTGMLNYSVIISSFFLSVFSILITCVLTKNFIIHLFSTLKWSIFSFYFFGEQVSAFPGLFLTINPFEIFISICLCLGELTAKLAPRSCSSLGLCPLYII